MSFAKRSARRRGMLMGAAISSSRNKKRQAIANANPAPAQSIPAPTQPAQATSPDSVKLLRELADLRDAGILTEAEFTAKKQQILGL